MIEVVVRVGPNGRIVIPAEFRRSLDLQPGDRLVAVLRDGGVHLYTPDQAIRRAQQIVRSRVRKGRRLSDELLEERRKEAKRDG